MRIFGRFQGVVEVAFIRWAQYKHAMAETVLPRQACGKVDHINRSVCHVNLKTIIKAR